jgi:hypothetical protein
MDKTDVIDDLIENYEDSDFMDIPDLCKRVWEAAIAHAGQQIEAEARLESLHDAATCVLRQPVCSDFALHHAGAEVLMANKILALAGAHARPQIETEARVAAFKDAYQAVEKLLVEETTDKPHPLLHNLAVKDCLCALDDLISTPPGFECLLATPVGVARRFNKGGSGT